MEPWQRKLTEALRATHSCVILGVGNDLKADDGVGPHIIEKLRPHLPSHVDLINAGTVPENFITHLTTTHPNLILIIDAALMNAPPGTIRIIDKTNIANTAFSTHQLPLTFLTEYLHHHLPKTTILILGVQPQTNQFGQPLSKPVHTAAQKIINTIIHALTPQQHTTHNHQPPKKRNQTPTSTK